MTGLYLVDRSAWLQVPHSIHVQRQLYLLRQRGSLATCAVVEAELLYSTRNQQEFLTRRQAYAALPRLAMTDQIHTRALDIMQALAIGGRHRTVSIPELLIAATAEAYGAVVLHYDLHFERIAEHAPFRHQWILERGLGRPVPR